MIDYGNVAADAWSTLASGLFVFMFFYVGKYMSDAYKPKWKNYFLILAIAGFLGFLAQNSLGSHTEDADPVYGGGDLVTDFEPTDQERNEHGLSTFLKIAVPALVGVYSGKKEDSA